MPYYIAALSVLAQYGVSQYGTKRVSTARYAKGQYGTAESVRDRVRYDGVDPVRGTVRLSSFSALVLVLSVMVSYRTVPARYAKSQYGTATDCRSSLVSESC